MVDFSQSRNVALWAARGCPASILALLLFASTAGAEELSEPRAKDHRRVMYFVDDQGQEQPVRSLTDWEQRRRDIIVGMEAMMGKLPDRSQLGPVPVQVVANSRVETEKFIREKLLLETEAGDHVPAWLLLPRNSSGRLPAIVALHQTNGALGKDEVAGLAGLKNLQYGRELAERGYVVLIPDYPTLGEYKYDFEKDRYISGSMKGIWNHMRCVDFLSGRPEVDPARIGSIGHSLGGHNAIFLGVFDPRVKVIVSSCGWTPAHDYYGGKLKGWDGERYMPLVNTRYHLDPNQVPCDFYEMTAALAPRGFFSCSPTGDDNFAVAGVKKTLPIVQPVFDLLKSSERLQVRYPECAHDFPPEVREEAYQFLDKLLEQQRSR